MINFTKLPEGLAERIANDKIEHPKTNADRIRAMSDEELADEVLRWFNWLNAEYHNGYMQALADVEKEIRLRFGFAERDNLIQMPFDGLFKAEEGEK